MTDTVAVAWNPDTFTLRLRRDPKGAFKLVKPPKRDIGAYVVKGDVLDVTIPPSLRVPPDPKKLVPAPKFT